MIKQMANTSPGTDSCLAKMLKSLPPEGIKTICKLYNYCLEGGTLPELCEAFQYFLEFAGYFIVE